MATNLSINGSDFYRFPDEHMGSSKMVLSRTNSNFSPTNGSDGFPNPLGLDDSPLSSPSDVECFQPGEEHNNTEKITNKKTSIRSRSGSLPVGVRLPQRKGGMHLWQFLYSILQMPEKYSHLIEWTSNQKEFEFRLVEPDAIAVWWGYHKNKKNMSYDKLSRSLRYYYDKQIIRKIGGERYVYRFCVDPEVMYKAIGNSENRPKLKPMPKSAENMLLKNQQARNSQSSQIHSPCSKPTFVAEEPNVLSHCTKNELSVSPPSSSMHYPVHNYTMSNSLPMENSTSRSDLSKGWQTQGKVNSPHTPYHNDAAYQEINYLYQMYPHKSAHCFPSQALVHAPMNESFLSDDDVGQSHFITYDQATSIPEASLTTYTDSRHNIASSYFSTNPTFVPEAEHEFTSLPDTIDSIATCNEYHGSVPIMYHQDVNNGVYAVYDNPVASWPPLVGTNSIAADFSTW